MFRLRSVRSIAAAAAALLLVAGCQGTRSTASQTYERTATASSELRLLYVHTAITTPPMRNPAIRAATPEELGYQALPGLIEARAPEVMARNGISGAAKSARRYGLTPEQARAALSADGSLGRAQLLTLQVMSGERIANTAGTTSITLRMHAELFDESWTRRLWSGEFDVMLGQSRALGYAGGVNEEFVDDMLGTVLEQLRDDGFVRVAGR